MKKTLYKRVSDAPHKPYIKPPARNEHRRKTEDATRGERPQKRFSIAKPSLPKTDDRDCLQCGKKGHLEKVCNASFWCDIKRAWGTHLKKISKTLREAAKVGVKYESPIVA